MQSHCRGGNIALSVSMVIACLTLIYLHHRSNTDMEGFNSQERTDCCLGKIKTMKEELLRNIKEEPVPLDLDQEDPRLAAYIRRQMAPPSELPYNLTHPEKEHFSQLGQTQFLMQKIFPGMKGGFFLEVGAAEGELFSNTLYLERRMNWRGLLIEASPASYQELLHKHRKAYSINAALSLTNRSCEVKFSVRGTKGVLSSLNKNGKITVRALPLYSILKALDVPVIDYLSLDIEGVEMEVLNTVPWDKVKVRVMHVEYNHLRGGMKDLTAAMEARGMHFIGTTSIDAWFVCPELFRHNIQSVTQARH